MSLEKSIEGLHAAVVALTAAINDRWVLVSANKEATASVEKQIAKNAPAAVVAEATAPTQKDVLAAFNKYAQSPGASPDMMRAIMADLGAKTVTAIAKEDWAKAIEMCVAAMPK